MTESLVNQKWTGQTFCMLLKSLLAHILNAFTQMQQCAQHVQHQVPDGCQRVTWLLDNIDCSDAPLQSAMAQAHADAAAGGPRVNFEQATTVTLPHCVVAKKHSAGGTKWKAGASESSANVFGMESKPSVGKTGVEFWLCAKEDCKDLTNEQKKELAECRKKKAVNNESSDDNSSALRKKQKANKKLIAAAVKQEIKKLKQESEGANNDEEHLCNISLSVVEEKNGTSSTPPAAAAAADTK